MLSQMIGEVICRNLHIAKGAMTNRAVIWVNVHPAHMCNELVGLLEAVCPHCCWKGLVHKAEPAGSSTPFLLGIAPEKCIDVHLKVTISLFMAKDPLIVPDAILGHVGRDCRESVCSFEVLPHIENM